MSTPTELWKNWEGHVVDGKFPLRQWLGGSDHSAVFLTERGGKECQKTAIKLTAAELDEGTQLSRWSGPGKLSHPHLIRLLDSGRCQIDETRMLYVVMEYAEENLLEILPLRPLAPDEALEMLRPAAEALASLHKGGFAHSRVKPSNIMAVDNHLKISADAIRRTGERGLERVRSAYDAPEVATAGPSPAADIWALGATLVAVLTQNEPKNVSRDRVAVPETIPQPFREIARQCLQVDPRERCTANDILSRLQTRTVPAKAVQTKAVQTHVLQTPAAQAQVSQSQVSQARATQAQAPIRAQAVEPRPSPKGSKRWIVTPVVIAVILLVVWGGSKLLVDRPSVPVADNHPASPQPPADNPPAQTPTPTPATAPAPFSEKVKPAKQEKGVVQGSVLHQVEPDVSRSALRTIEGRLKVVVEVSVDASGNVSQARLSSPGPSTYFANRALAAARDWKFNPPQVNGQAAASEWVLRFQFRKTTTEVLPSEKTP
jgi:TonB family protein